MINILGFDLGVCLASSCLIAILVIWIGVVIGDSYFAELCKIFVIKDQNSQSRFIVMLLVQCSCPMPSAPLRLPRLRCEHNTANRIELKRTEPSQPHAFATVHLDFCSSVRFCSDLQQ